MARDVPMQDRPPAPDGFAVTVLMRRHPVTGNPWIDERWEVLGVIPEQQPVPTAGAAGPPAAATDPLPADEIVRYDGLMLRLHADEAESYYHNLMVNRPLCYVVCRPAADGTPRPVLVTASFDQANAYVEGDERVDAVPLPDALYAPIETFVLTHFVPTRRPKRKRKDWRSP